MRGYVYHYVGNGMEEGEFYEAYDEYFLKTKKAYDEFAETKKDDDDGDDN
eukprot:CAMPEP_0114592372 /NCGR_PEP_ID=MMETSP0125-20121206/14215_1 /TAXON_ID=485358 ORGANISM="Aristerostoma sp., Strain ATCC 50986" /NCGR_SAMPLE_ID=MMETSP0125 /ASSEMBLY_ACC=CAM_ASM_000245 /LENGTH=49 /DNA_ID=CAMNT_0001790983 /DNA_START=645 /DNA_END=794 /DNA_ORIENTATION=+